MKKIVWILFAIVATVIGLYPITYFVIDREFGLLSSKSFEILFDPVWNIAFYGHIIFGGIALLIGWFQFDEKQRTKNISLHRNLGKTYVISVLISGICGFYLALYATGGIISTIGFASLAIVWLVTTILGFDAIAERRIEAHKKWMIYSYATCFSAVMLRIWLPLLTATIGDFVFAYRIVAWLCWVPNIIAAYFIVRRKNRGTNDQIS